MIRKIKKQATSHQGHPVRKLTAITNNHAKNVHGKFEIVALSAFFNLHIVHCFKRVLMISAVVLL